MSVKSFYLTAAGPFAAIATIPLLVGLAHAWFENAGFLIFILALPIAVFLLLTLSIACLVHGYREFRQEEALSHRIAILLASPFLLLLTICLSWPSLIAGGYIGDLSRLAINKTRYDAIVERARMTRKEEWFAEQRGVRYSVDPGPPVRVAFNPAGFLDNWSGIVFDPTGEMMRADGFDPLSGKFRAPDRITKLFGGDLVWCRHLYGDYYRCSFT